MCHFKEIDVGLKNIISNFGGTEPPIRANLLFGYAQSGSERTSFSGSTVLVLTGYELQSNIYLFIYYLIVLLIIFQLIWIDLKPFYFLPFFVNIQGLSARSSARRRRRPGAECAMLPEGQGEAKDLPCFGKMLDLKFEDFWEKILHAAPFLRKGERIPSRIPPWS